MMILLNLIILTVVLSVYRRKYFVVFTSSPAVLIILYIYIYIYIKI